LNPNLGEKSIDGLLRAQGIRVQHYRIRDTLHAVDPEGVQYRLRRVLHRRQYSVESPNALWHVDGPQAHPMENRCARWNRWIQ